MQLKVFAVPAQGGEELVEEMNKFLRAHRVLSIEKRLVEQGGAYWSFCVEYLERGGEGGGPGTADRAKRGVDYKEILSTEDFAVFAKLRDLRKEMAEKEGVPPYAVFTNEQLAARTATTTGPTTPTTTTDSAWPEFNPTRECRRPETDPATVPPAP